MNEAPADSPLPPPPPDTGWSRRRLVWATIFVFAVQVGALFLFGGKKAIAPRAPARVPHLQLASPANELIALYDPTLFVLPHPNGFGAPLWQQPVTITAHGYRHAEPPQFLDWDTNRPGADVEVFVRTNQFAAYTLDFRPAPALAQPEAADAPATAASSLRVVGDLAARPLLNPPQLPALPGNAVLPPSRVQALVDAAGTVASLILLPPENALEARDRADLGDTNALRVARTLRFAPAAQATFGEIIFHWQTVPPTATNAP
jgi:hypothetical protein